MIERVVLMSAISRTGPLLSGDIEDRATCRAGLVWKFLTIICECLPSSKYQKAGGFFFNQFKHGRTCAFARLKGACVYLTLY